MPTTRSEQLPSTGIRLHIAVHGNLDAGGTRPSLLFPGAFLSTDSMRRWVDTAAPRRAQAEDRVVSSCRQIGWLHSDFAPDSAR